MSNWRIKLVNDQWGWSYGNESSGLSLWGYATKAEAVEAVDTYKRMDAAGVDLAPHIVVPPAMPSYLPNN